MVNRKHIATLLLVLTVALAGCSTIPFLDNGQPETPTNNTSSNNSSIEYPYGWNESGLQEFATQEDSLLLQESSLTITFERTIELKTASSNEFNVETKTVQTHKVDAVQERWNITSEQPNENILQQYYFSDNTEYSRTVLRNESGGIESKSYDSALRSFTKQTAYQISGGEVLILGVDFNSPTVTTYNGNEALHYEVNDLDKVANNSPIYSIGEATNLTSVESDLYVDKQTGNILSIETTAVGTRANDEFRATLVFQYSNFSNTTVHEPGWVDTARNETSAGSGF